jgi:hypothetical protein
LYVRPIKPDVLRGEIQMKKIIHTFVALLMITTFPTTQAHAGNLGVNAAINQLNYKLNVQWDQHDQAFKKAAYATFTTQVAELQASGVSADQIVSALKAKMPDAQTAHDVEAMATQAKIQGMNGEQVNKLVFNYMQRQATGASWNDSATYTAISVGVLVLVAVILLAGGTINIQSTSYSSPGYWSSCYDYYYGYYYDCYIYY